MAEHAAGDHSLCGLSSDLWALIFSYLSKTAANYGDETDAEVAAQAEQLSDA